MLVRKYQPRQTTGYNSKITILTQLARYIRQKREMMRRMAVLMLPGAGGKSDCRKAVSKYFNILFLHFN